MRYIVRIILLIFLLFSANAQASARSPLSQLTIIVSSYDKYSSLWEPFFHLLFENWPSLKASNKNIKIVLVANNKTYDDPRVFTSLSPFARGWSGNVNDALKHVHTKYVLYLQDDYFIRNKVDEKVIAGILKAMNKLDLDYVELYKRIRTNGNTLPLVKGYNYLSYQAEEEIMPRSLQASIWRKDVLSYYTNNKIKIWDFEYLPVNQKHKFAFYNKNYQPINYANIMLQGKIHYRSLCWFLNKCEDKSFDKLLQNLELSKKSKFFFSSLWYKQHYPTLFIGFCKLKGYLKNIQFFAIDKINQFKDGIGV